MSTSPISKLRAAEDERQTKQNSLADKLTVEAKALADLKVEKAAVEGERRTVEADLGPVRYLATLFGADNEAVLRLFILVVACLLDPAAGAAVAGHSFGTAALIGDHLCDRAASPPCPFFAMQRANSTISL